MKAQLELLDVRVKAKVTVKKKVGQPKMFLSSKGPLKKLRDVQQRAKGTSFYK